MDESLYLIIRRDQSGYTTVDYAATNYQACIDNLIQSYYHYLGDMEYSIDGYDPRLSLVYSYRNNTYTCTIVLAIFTPPI